MSVWLSPFEYLKKIWGGLYLESGFFTFDSFTSPIPDGTGAQVHYNAQVTTNLTNSYPDQGSATVDIGLTGEAAISGETLATGFDSRSFIFKTGDDEDIFTSRHAAMTKVPASVFAGKLRLLVQALYGSNRTDVIYPSGLTDDYPQIQWESEIINSQAKGFVNSGLLTTPDHDYFLIQMGGGTAEFIKLEFPDHALPLIDLLNANAFGATLPLSSSAKTRAEAYLLSTAKLSTEVYTATFTPIAGFIMYYGWHWNWEGSRGDAILHEITVNGSDLAEFHVRHAKLEITYTVTLGVYAFTVTATELEHSTWPRPPGWFSLHYPYPEDNKLINAMYLDLFPPAGKSLIDTYTDFTNIPVYCFRDEDDNLKIVRISQNVEYKTNTDTSTSSWVPFPNDHFSTNIRTYNGINGNVNLTCDDHIINKIYVGKSIETYDSNRVSTIFNFSGNGSRTFTYPGHTNPLAGGGTIGDYLVATGFFTRASPTSNCIGIDTGETIVVNGSTRNIYYGARSANGRVDYFGKYNDTSGSQDIPRIALIIPYHSCSAILTADQQETGARVYQERKRLDWQSTNIHSQVQIIKVYTHPSTGNTIMHSTVQVVPGTQYNNPGVPATGVTNTNINTPESHAGEMNCVLESNVFLVGTKTTEVFDYFINTTLDPTVETPDYVKHCITGGYKLNAGYLGWIGTEIINEYPGTVSIGWA